MNDKERLEWIIYDEPLYRLAGGEYGRKRDFIRANRQAIDATIADRQHSCRSGCPGCQFGAGSHEFDNAKRFGLRHFDELNVRSA
jgi:hypothetical protein